MSSWVGPKAGVERGEIQARLITRVLINTPLDERPFAGIGHDLGLSEDEVIERLRALLAQGLLSRFGPLFGDAAPASELDEALRSATQSGLPLVPRPFEAVGAMLGVSEACVRARLAAMLADGSILRVGAVLQNAQSPG